MFTAITLLSDEDRGRIAAHLLRLSPEDRSLRFNAGFVTDAYIEQLVQRLDFGRDIFMGLVSKRGLLVGLVHGAVYSAGGRRHVEAAFSVDAEWRGRGYGARLMEAVLLRTGNAGGAVLVGTCAARNLPMRRIFERAEMALTREDDEMAARRDVPPSEAAGACVAVAA